MIKSSKTYSPLAIVLCILVLLLASCRLGRQPTPTPLALNLSGKGGATPVPAVQTFYTVVRGEVVQRESYTGRVIPSNQEDLVFRRAGNLAQVYVEDGARVKAGDVIAVLEEEGLELDLEFAQLAVETAQEDLAQAEEDLIYDRREAELTLSLLEMQAPDAQTIAAQDSQVAALTSASYELELTLAKLRLSRMKEKISPIYVLNLRKAEFNLAKLKQSILDGQLKAPFDGEVRFIKLSKEEGKEIPVAANDPVARLVDTSSFKIELNLPRAQLVPLREGLPVRISAANLVGGPLDGVITALPRPFGTSSGSLVEVALMNAPDNAKLDESMTVAVSAALQSKQDALVIPRAALREKDQLYYVLLQENEKLYEVTIAVGILGDDLVEVIAGLEDGQVIAIDG